MKDAVPALFRLPVVSGYRYSAGAPLIQTVTGTGAYAKSMTRAFSGSGTTFEAGLIQASDIEYIGAFKFPATGGGVEDTLHYAAGVMTYDPANHSIYIAGFGGANIFEYEVPTLSFAESVAGLTTASAARQANFKPLSALTKTHPAQVSDETIGMILYENHLIVNRLVYYTGEETGNTTFVIENPRSLHRDSVRGYFNMQGNEKCAGYMGRIPPGLQAELGGQFFCGNSLGLSVDGRLSDGPSFRTFNPAEVVSLTTPGAAFSTSAPLLEYPRGDGLRDKPPGKAEADRSIMYQWSEMCRARSGLIPNGARTLMGVGVQAGANSGTHYDAGPIPNDTSDYDFHYWLYDLDDLIAVKNGAAQMNAPAPYYNGILPGPAELIAPLPATYNHGRYTEMNHGCYDPGSGLLYVPNRERDDGRPIVMVYKIEKAA